MFSYLVNAKLVTKDKHSQMTLK